MNDEVTQRLLDEIRQKETLIAEIKLALYEANMDLELLSLVGAIRKLVLDCKNQRNEIADLKSKIIKQVK